MHVLGSTPIKAPFDYCVIFHSDRNHLPVLNFFLRGAHIRNFMVASYTEEKNAVKLRHRPQWGLSYCWNCEGGTISDRATFEKVKCIAGTEVLIPCETNSKPRPWSVLHWGCLESDSQEMKEKRTLQLFSSAVYTDHAQWLNSINLLPMAFYLLTSLQMSATNLSGQFFPCHSFTTT